MLNGGVKPLTAAAYLWRYWKPSGHGEDSDHEHCVPWYEDENTHFTARMMSAVSKGSLACVDVAAGYLPRPQWERFAELGEALGDGTHELGDAKPYYVLQSRGEYLNFASASTERDESKVDAVASLLAVLEAQRVL